MRGNKRFGALIAATLVCLSIVLSSCSGIVSDILDTGERVSNTAQLQPEEETVESSSTSSGRYRKSEETITVKKISSEQSEKADAYAVSSTERKSETAETRQVEPSEAKESKSSSSETSGSAKITIRSSDSESEENENQSAAAEVPKSFSLAGIPAFSTKAYVAVNDNVPYFTADECTATSYEYYSPLDSLGRCGVCVASIGRDIMPTEERGEIGMVKPTGWHTVKYDCVDGKYLYNRCHLIGYQLAGENANTRNLITGTRYLNIEGMLPFENMVADYVQETGNHVMYRVTPIFDGDNLLATGVLMEGYSVEDSGDGICFNVFCYNAQPDVTIDYATGDSIHRGEKDVVSESVSVSVRQSTETVQESTEVRTESVSADYILNTNTKKFHYPTCSSVSQMKDKNKRAFSGDREDVIAQGYVPCKKCNP